MIRKQRAAWVALALALAFSAVLSPAVAMAAKARAAVIEEQGVTFAVVHVDYAIVKNEQKAARVQSLYEEYFHVPVVLMSDDAKRTKWYGRGDIVDFLSDYSFGDIPWEVYELTD